MKVLITLLATLFFTTNLSSFSDLTPAQVCDINYTHQEKVYWFINSFENTSYYI